MPSTAPVSGGMQIRINGNNFDPGAVVRIDGVTCTGFQYLASIEIRVTVPAHSAGPADVEIENPDLQKAFLAGGVTYTTAPIISGITPVSGPTSGATLLTVNGFGFQSGITVTIGGVSATSVNRISANQLTCLTPAGTAGAKDVVVTNPDVQSATYSSFSYYSGAPQVSSVTPISGTNAGGNTVTVSGSNFQTGATVKFGGVNSPSVTNVTATSLNAVVPTGPHAPGIVDVTVTNPDLSSGTKTAAYTYVFSGTAPTVSSITPSSGPTAGGTSVTIAGTGFQVGITVTIGGASATSVNRTSSTSLTCVTPAGTAGARTVTVTNPDYGSGSLTSGYTYTAPATYRVPTYSIDSSSGVDLWLYDRQTQITRFRAAMVAGGLHTNGADVTTDSFAEDYLHSQILGHVSQFYKRNFNGTKISGASFNICFVGVTPGSPWIAPPATQGNAQPNQYNVMQLMDTDPQGGGALGRAFVDTSTQTGGLPANGKRENNSRANNCGVFMTPIWNNLVSWSRVSVLNPALSSSDLQYVDGTYTLGSGTTQQDTRFTNIRNRIVNFADGLATVGMHETGHSLGQVITSRQSSGHCPSSSCPMKAVATWGTTSFCTGASSCTSELAASLGYSP